MILLEAYLPKSSRSVHSNDKEATCIWLFEARKRVQVLVLPQARFTIKHGLNVVRLSHLTDCFWFRVGAKFPGKVWLPYTPGMAWKLRRAAPIHFSVKWDEICSKSNIFVVTKKSSSEVL